MLKGETAIVSGSTRGIGLDIAQALAAAGAHVMLNGLGEKMAIDFVRPYGIKAGYSAAAISMKRRQRGRIINMGPARGLVASAGYDLAIRAVFRTAKIKGDDRTYMELVISDG